MTAAAADALSPQQVADRALAASRADGTVVLVEESSSANLRWADNSLTTNGLLRGRRLTVIAVVGSRAGYAAGSVSRTVARAEDVARVVADAEEAARGAGPAPDARPLVEGPAAPDWAAEPEQTSTATFAGLAPALGEAFGRARSGGRQLFGYVEHTVATTYLASSTGLRLRHVQPTGYLTMTGRAPGAEEGATASAWVGAAGRDLSGIDVPALEAELDRRLGWAKRRVELPAGRYPTLLPPTAVADLMIYLYWTLGARDAHDGRSVFSRPGGGVRVGERFGPAGLTLRSDPAHPGLECAPFAVAHASDAEHSVFDNGLPLAPTDWIADGHLRALFTSREVAELTRLPVRPPIDNLVLDAPGGAARRGSVDDLVAGTERGLLLTCLWYIREVDPQTLLLTGLTRDGVYLVEHGEVTAEVNNFRFNESPVDLLGRFTAAGATVPAYSREWGEYFPRVAVPALLVPDFNMSTVSRAS